MTGGPRQRQRGTIDALPSGALRVRVYAGPDPLTKRRHDLTEVIPPGSNAAREAEKAWTRLLNQVDERRNPRTRAKVNQLLDRWLEVLHAEPSTRRGYVLKIEKHVRPMLGGVQVARVDAELLETFYARLRKCRDHCDGRRYVQHRTPRPHECDDRCRRHACVGLSVSTIRQIHWILSGALDRAVRWKWIAINPAERADKPALPHPDPQPPSVDEAARIVTEAWRDPDWGTFVWCAMTLGARRGELCALRWQHVDLDTNVVVTLAQGDLRGRGRGAGGEGYEDPPAAAHRHRRRYRRGDGRTQAPLGGATRCARPGSVARSVCVLRVAGREYVPCAGHHDAAI
ncbi:tyrosine recombinase XerC [Krasilnikovia sp. MM14-A1259]|uniref:site-specific integrase n=1 Tax=Krasilnikovia sp. MM14-A1259 TaxID=3373539 RepID=UPI00381F1D9A